MSIDMRALVERQREAAAVDASVDKLRWLLAEQTHQLDPADRAFADLACKCPPKACGCEADYPGFAEWVATREADNRRAREAS